MLYYYYKSLLCKVDYVFCNHFLSFLTQKSYHGTNPTYSFLQNVPFHTLLPTTFLHDTVGDLA